MSDLHITSLWFKRAVQVPTKRNLDVQVGCHLEECREMLDCVQLKGVTGNIVLKALRLLTGFVATNLKNGAYTLEITDRKEFLDSLADQIVTATGCGHMAEMDVPTALARVNSSNFSKFDKDGMPIFDENGKIKKGPNFTKPDLTGLY